MFVLMFKMYNFCDVECYDQTTNSALNHKTKKNMKSRISEYLHDVSILVIRFTCIILIFTDQNMGLR